MEKEVAKLEGEGVKTRAAYWEQMAEDRAKAKSNQEGSPALGHRRIDEDVLRPVPEPAQHTHANRQQQKEKDSAPAQTADSRRGMAAAHMSAAEVSGIGSMKTQNVALAEL